MCLKPFLVKEYIFFNVKEWTRNPSLSNLLKFFCESMKIYFLISVWIIHQLFLLLLMMFDILNSMNTVTHKAHTFLSRTSVHVSNRYKTKTKNKNNNNNNRKTITTQYYHRITEYIRPMNQEELCYPYWIHVH